MREEDNTKISGVSVSAFIYRLFHEDFSSIVARNTVDLCLCRLMTTCLSKDIPCHV